MNAHDPDHIQDDADKIRQDIADTAEAIQDRMSPGKLIDDFMGYMKRSDGVLALGNLRTQARDNPMALAVIGSGIAWLIFGSGEDHGQHRDRSSGNRRGQTSPPASARRGSANNGTAGAFSSGASMVGEGMDAMANRASDLAGRARHAVDDASDQARDLADDVVDQGHAAVDTVRDLAQRGRRSIMEVMEQEPLVLGAIGMAVGAAIGAMLPGTDLEDETVGDMRDSLLREAGQAVDQAAGSARQVGSEALEAARSAAREVTPG
jgi:uncharacterized protein YjbJ (UPF0337 family)